VSSQDTQELIKVTNLSKSFSVSKNLFGKTTKNLRAVSNVSLEIFSGECLCVVGESGCGKSTLARLMLNLIKPDSGSVQFQGQDIFKLDSNALIKARTNMQMVFQNPFSSLDPRYKIFDTIAEPLIIHRKDLSKEAIQKKVFDLLNEVELDSSIANKYPHQCSGGQNQRVSIARALALDPKFIIADEAVSALDVSIQWKILELFKRIQKEKNISFLFIAHNLGVVKHIADRVAVMYLGEIVEIASKQDIFNNPLHPYTQALISSAPVADPHQRNRQKKFLEGELPKPTKIPSGCAFHTRCPIAEKQCSETTPKLEEKSSKHFASCNLI
jgi:peptide/nickel transport system ATP-binding protein/oligopeptide transport system ATP-binding protein